MSADDDLVLVRRTQLTAVIQVLYAAQGHDDEKALRLARREVERLIVRLES